MELLCNNKDNASRVFSCLLSSKIYILLLTSKIKLIDGWTVNKENKVSKFCSWKVKAR